jgi:hypothetical protein
MRFTGGSAPSEYGGPQESSDEAVIGEQTAAAVAAESRRVARVDAPSPLDVAYEARSAFDLFRYVETPVDARVASFVERFAAADAQQRADLRLRLSRSDLYTLLTFARRRALCAVRNRDLSSAVIGFQAVAAIELARVDRRDASMALGMLAYAAEHLDGSASALLIDAASHAEQDLAKLMVKESNAASHELKRLGLREVTFSTGVGLVDDQRHRFQPAKNLLALAEQMVAVIENDTYRVTDIAIGTRLPLVWLPAGEHDVLTKASRALSGCLNIHARPAADLKATFPSHWLLVFICEAAHAEDAALLTAASRSRPSSDIAELGVSAGPLCTIMVARPTMRDASGIETADSLRRFNDPIRSLLTHSP